MQMRIRGHLWLSTVKGLSWYDSMINDFQCHTFTLSFLQIIHVQALLRVLSFLSILSRMPPRSTAKQHHTNPEPCHARSSSCKSMSETSYPCRSCQSGTADFKQYHSFLTILKSSYHIYNKMDHLLY